MGREAAERKPALYRPRNIPFLNHHFCFHLSKIAAMMWQPVNGGWGGAWGGGCQACLTYFLSSQLYCTGAGGNGLKAAVIMEARNIIGESADCVHCAASPITPTVAGTSEQILKRG